MAVKITSSGPRGAKTYEVRWKDGELYGYTDTSHHAKQLVARARKEEREFYSPRKRNPTKAQRRAKARNAAKKRGIVEAVHALVKKLNPTAKITGAEVVRLKHGVLKITPVKANAGKRDYGIYPKYAVFPGGVTFKNRKTAIKEARESGAAYVEDIDKHQTIWVRRGRKR
jgi:hypothetical protein